MEYVASGEATRTKQDTKDRATERPPYEFRETFEESFDPSRFLTKIPNKNSEVRNGVLWTRGDSGGKYPPMVYLGVEGKDLKISFRYRHLENGGMVWFFVDGDDGFGSVDHMLRVKLNRTGVQIQIDAHSLDPNHPDRQNSGRPADKVSGAYRLNKKFGQEQVDLSANVWHKVTLAFKKDTVTISIDGNAWTKTLKHACFNEPKRKLLWMQNGGEKGIELDDIHIRETGGNSFDRTPRQAAQIQGDTAQIGVSNKRVHRLESSFRSPFDAFLYVNRIPSKLESDETHDDLAGRVLGRLANQEGRILIKLPPGMDKNSYEGFKLALETHNDSGVGSCFACHHLPSLSDVTAKQPVPTLRNLKLARDRLKDVLVSEVHRKIAFDEQDINRLHSLLKSLIDVSDDKFRELILKATVLDTSGDSE